MSEKRKTILTACLFLLCLAGCTANPPAVPPAPSETPNPTSTSAPAPSATAVPQAATAPAVTQTPTTTPATATPEEPVQPQGLAPSAIQPGNVDVLEQAYPFQVGEGYEFAWLNDSESVVMAGNEQLLVMGFFPPEQVFDLEAQSPRSVRTSPATLGAAWVESDSQIRLWVAASSPSDEVEVRTLEGHTTPVISLAFSPDASRLASADDSGALLIWDLSSGAALQTWQVPSWFWISGFSPDGVRLAGVTPEEFALHILDIETGEIAETFVWADHASPVLYGVALSPDWTTAAWYTRGTIQLMDLESGEFGAQLEHEDFISAIDWSPGGGLIASAAGAMVDGEYSPVIVIWDPAAGEALRTLVLSEPAMDLAFSPDGRYLGALTAGGEMLLWSVP